MVIGEMQSVEKSQVFSLNSIISFAETVLHPSCIPAGFYLMKALINRNNRQEVNVFFLKL